MVASQDVVQAVKGKEIERGGHDSVHMCLPGEVEDVQRVHVWVGEVPDERRFHGALDELVVPPESVRPSLEEVPDGLAAEMGDEVLGGETEDAGDIVEVLDPAMLECPASPWKWDLGSERRCTYKGRKGRYNDIK